MSIIKLIAKVKLLSEDDMEIESELDLNNFKSQKWVWRYMAFSAEEIYKLISYSSNKTLILLHDGDKFLVKETFENVYNLWIENLPEDLDLSDEGLDENYEISGDEN